MRCWLYCLFYGFFYEYCAGLFHLPKGLAATLVGLVSLLSLRRIIYARHHAIPWQLSLLSLSAGIISISFMSLTNEILLAICWICLLSILLIFLITNGTGEMVRCCSGFFFNGCALLSLAFQTFISMPGSEKQEPQQASELKEKRGSVVVSTIASGTVLLIFHALFREANLMYREWMDHILLIILDADFWLFVFKGVFIGHLAYSFVKPCWEHVHPGVSNSGAFYLTHAVVSSCCLFLIFSGFQLPYMTLDPQQMAYKDYSLYVQRGFWELVAAGLLGHQLWAICRLVGTDVSEYLSKKTLLMIFSAELFLISIFTLHKIGMLQLTYGLKDTRLLATAGVAIALVTFFLCTFIGWGRVRATHIFHGQLIAVSFVIAAFSIGNLDLLVSRYHPIRYEREGVWRTDYAYLLMNSYDNYEEWGEIILDAFDKGVDYPANYYWGSYYPLCHQGYQGVRNRLREHHDRARSVYSKGDTLPVRKLLQYSRRVGAAGRWLKANDALVQDFYKLIESHCEPA